MDHDKLRMTSETGEKENSSANDNNAGRFSRREECAGSNSEENNATRLLQPFFVADTLEDDESIIPPSQEDSDFLIPSTPAFESDKRSENVDPNDSTISMLEETCVLENKPQCNESPGKDAAACNESDMTQDLEELEVTQPLIPSNHRIEESFTEVSNNPNKSKVVEDEDDDWQLKFSETQTQEALLNFQKNEPSDDEAETQKILIGKDDKPEENDDDDDLPATLSIEVPQRSVQEEVKEPRANDNVETLDTQSDDEIEPSQSCLSEFKGETISASFKVQPVVETSNEEIPVLCPEKEIKNDENNKSDIDITMIDESEKRTITLSESEPRNIFSESKDNVEAESLSVQETPVEIYENNKKLGEKIHSVGDVVDKRSKNSEVEIEIDDKMSVDNNISNDSTTKVTDERNEKRIETNGNQIEEIEIIDDVLDAEFKNKKAKSSKIIEKKNIKSKLLESDASDIINSEEHDDVETKKENIKLVEEKSSSSIETSKNKVENNVDLMERDDEEEKGQILPCIEANKAEIIEVNVTKNIETFQQASVEKIQESDLQQKSDTSATKKVDSEAGKPAEILPASEPNKVSGENALEIKRISDEKTATPSKFFPFAKPSSRNFGSSRKQKAQSQNLSSDLPLSQSCEKVASFKDAESLENFFKSFGVTVDRERLEAILSKPNEVIEFKTVFKIWNCEIFLKDFSIENEHRQESGISPIFSSSTATSSNVSSKISHSGEADISSSLSSGDMFPKTSTQKSPQNIAELTSFGIKNLSEISKTETDISPIVAKQNKKSPAPKRKRAKKNVESSSSDVPAEPKNKRAKGKAKPKVKIVVDKSDETEESKDAVPEEKPKKPTRRKKGATYMPDIKPEEIKLIIENMDTSTDDQTSFQEDANFGTILPGCSVMARWKDGYYYSGMVQSQELHGKWAVLFEDGLLHTISPECLIKIAILPKGTSVLVQTPDGFYDPGIVCGHFREGNKVGYEVELDNGVTRRYTRSAVSLSIDQAKLLMKNAPPTTPATMTINLDNIVDGKRKRKSIQSPIVAPPVKKSPRVTRSKKPDSNLDSTESSSTSEVVPDKSKDSEIEEPPAKKKKAKKGAKETVVAPATTETSSVISKPSGSSVSIPSTSSIPIPSTSSASTSKTTKLLPQRTKKLFKDYAFLLTNADRKPKPIKPMDTSDSEEAKEEEDIVPFDKDELCNHIASGGGIVLEKFDDIKKCTRKHIYLLANTYLRTMKYIQCIAAGISCIKHHWVQNCIFMSEILGLTRYILPAGFSIVTQQVVEWHGKTDVFKNCKIVLVSDTDSHFVNIWAPVLLAAKADFVQKWNLPSSVSGCSLEVDVLITNQYCPPDIIQSAKKRKIPILSSEWIIQCLITGKKLPYDAHPKFKYDYTEKKI